LAVDVKIKDLVEKVIPVSTDQIPINDVAGGNVDKHIQVGNFPDITPWSKDHNAAGFSLVFAASGIIVQEVSDELVITVKDDVLDAGINIKNSDGGIAIRNGSNVANNFRPTILMSAFGGATQFNQLLGEIPVADDSGTVPVFEFNLRQDDDTPIVTRPLFGVSNDNIVAMRVEANGDLTMTAGNNLVLSTTGALELNSTVSISGGTANQMQLTTPEPTATGVVNINTGTVRIRNAETTGSTPNIQLKNTRTNGSAGQAQFVRFVNENAVGSEKEQSISGGMSTIGDGTEDGSIEMTVLINGTARAAGWSGQNAAFLSSDDNIWGLGTSTLRWGTGHISNLTAYEPMVVTAVASSSITLKSLEDPAVVGRRGSILWNFNDSGNNPTQWGDINCRVLDATSGGEDSVFGIEMIAAGSLVELVNYNSINGEWVFDNTNIRIASGFKLMVDSDATEAGFFDAGHTADPSSATKGDMYMNTTDNEYRFYDGTNWRSMNADDITTINFVIDGGGSAITTGIKGQVVIDFPCEVIEWAIIGLPAGAIVVDVSKSTFAGFPTTTTLTASEKPTISATNDTGEDRALTTWTSIVAGDILEFEVDSVATIERCTVALKCRKTG